MQLHKTLPAALVLSRLSGQNVEAYRRLVRHDGMFDRPEPAFRPLCDTVLSPYNQALAEAELERWSGTGIRAISLFDEAYPVLLRQHPHPPLVLFLKGETELSAVIDEGAAVALVGSRNASVEGCQTAQRFASMLAAHGVCVVSGLAMGIDGSAHQGALESEGCHPRNCPTIAVLGNGLDAIYPPKHRSLGQQILKAGGLLISQFPPGTPPYPSHFLERNGLIAYLSRAVVVVQAANRSGALSTARWALDAGRDVMAVPGSLYDLRHQGTNQLIQSGAHLVTKPEDILDLIGVTSARDEKQGGTAPEESSSLLEQTLREHGGCLHLLRLSQLLERVLSPEELCLLELSGKIVLLPGDLVRIN